jgi:PAS domain S-box-containing protein
LDFERCQPWRERAEDFILETEFGDDAGEKQGGPDGTMEFRRQEALLQAGALQRAIFNSANFSSIATDAKGVIQIFNVGAERMLGYTAAEVMNKITPADISDPQEVIARAAELSLELGTPITPGFEALGFKASRGIEDIYELTYIRKDGSRFPAVVSVTALRDAQNAIIGYLLIGTDNTARKLAEDVLREVEVLKNYNERLVSKLKEKNTELLAQTETLRLPNAAMTAAANAIVITDRDGSIVWANPAFSTLTGYTLAETVGKNLRDLVKSGQQERAFYEEMWATILAGRIWHGQLVNRRKDGSLYPEDLTITPVRDANGKITHFIAIKLDLTERKAAEEALLQAGALQRAIFNSANFSSIATDAKGVIQIFNVGAERMLGYTAAEVMNKITPADISDPQEVIARAAALSVELGTPITPGFEALVFKASRGIEDIYELTYIRKDGSRFPAVVSVTALRDAQNTIIGYLLIGTDNTARKLAEEALLRSELLAGAGRLAASIAHEINNPLEALINTIYLARMTADLPESAREYLDIADGEIASVAHIVRQRLGFYREFSAATSNSASALIGSVVNLLKAKIRASEAIVEQQCDEQLQVMGVSGELRQVLANLLANSLDSIDQGGRIVLRASASIDPDDGRRRFRITVADCGHGMGAATMKQIFDPFFTTKGSVGTGLGLWVCKQLVDKNGGSIRVRSNMDGERGGTTFSVVLPKDAAMPATSV